MIVIQNALKEEEKEEEEKEKKTISFATEQFSHCLRISERSIFNRLLPRLEDFSYAL